MTSITDLNPALLADHEKWMRAAIEEGLKAKKLSEVPVGAVIVLNETIIGRGHNQPIGLNDPTAHAEIMALRSASQNINNYRLPGALMYVTLEPCMMCIGAILHARLDHVYFGAADPKTGAAKSVLNLFDEHKINHQTSVTGGILSDTCSQLLKDFFQERRVNK